MNRNINKNQSSLIRHVAYAPHTPLPSYSQGILSFDKNRSYIENLSFIIFLTRKSFTSHQSFLNLLFTCNKSHNQSLVTSHFSFSYPLIYQTLVIFTSYFLFQVVTSHISTSHMPFSLVTIHLRLVTKHLRPMCLVTSGK